ncbi:MAG: hypothetical protein IJP59_06020 [Muribaculaceae bacterium]|nr:hypothetical protein [Muribaculaceae bacterium]
MKKFLIFFLMLLPLAITSCGDDKDEPKNEPQSKNETQYDIRELKMSGNGILLKCELYCMISYQYASHLGRDVFTIGFRNSYYGGYATSKFVSANCAKVGKVNNLSDIKSIPTSGWQSWEHSFYDVELNDGFVVEIYDGSQFYYFRLMLSKIVTNSNNNIVDAVILVQQFTR